VEKETLKIREITGDGDVANGRQEMKVVRDVGAVGTENRRRVRWSDHLDDDMVGQVMGLL
jgi:hypothetical protein